MSAQQLDKILEKAKKESHVSEFGLYNWADPLLHPKLPELVKVVNEHGVTCSLSTNLNRLRDADELMRSNPSLLIISLSGFHQETYGLTHRRGDIETVKKNMLVLADAKIKTGSKTKISVSFHRYLSNLSEEEPLKNLAKELDFSFEPCWANWLPLEKVLAASGNTSYGVITPQDKDLLQNLAVPLYIALDSAKKVSSPRCYLNENIITLNYRGDIQLCCGVYDSSRFTIGNYMALSLSQIQAARRAHSACSDCMKNGVHDYFLYNIPNLDSLAQANINKLKSHHDLEN